MTAITRLYDLNGRTVVVTGATGVLGGAIASAIAECGANLIVVARHVEAGERVIQSLGVSADRAAVVCGDVLERDSLEGAARDIVRRFGMVDALVNAAGGNVPEATTAVDRSFFDLDVAALRQTLDLNLLGTMLPAQVFGREMASAGEGVILNITSLAGFRPLTRVPAYAAAKAAVSNFTQWLAVHMAQEYSPRIRVNAIAPGFFLTRQNAFLLVDHATGALTARGETILAHTPMRRFGAPEDLVGAVLWLLSPASAFVTGIVVPIDGGVSAYGGV